MKKVSTGTVGLAMTNVKNSTKSTKVLKPIAMAVCCQNQY